MRSTQVDSGGLTAISVAMLEAVGAPAHDRQGVWVLTLDPGRFLAPGQLETETERLVRYVRSATPLPGQEVLVPGEPSARAVEALLRDGTPVLAPRVVESL